MECESESTETMIIFWSLLNEVLEKFTGKKGCKFNPVGWAVDEHGGNWASIRAVYGEESVNERTVSCEFHFKQSIVRHARHLGSAKSQTKFKVLANKLLSCATVKNYEEAYFGLKNFIEKKPEKRGFLTSWLEWWNERKAHFVHAFKPVGAAPVNLSAAYHSSYATTGSKGLKLIDAAYKDIVIALRLERSLELYGQGIKCQGSGPSGAKRRKRDFTAQSQRAKEYAEVILDEELSDNNAQCSMDNSKVNEERVVSASSSENETDVRRNKKRTSGKMSAKKGITFCLTLARYLSSYYTNAFCCTIPTHLLQVTIKSYCTSTHGIMSIFITKPGKRARYLVQYYNLILRVEHSV